MFVTKANGAREPFRKSKIIDTCTRMGLKRKEAKAIANEIERRAYDGISTKEILNMIFELARHHKPHFQHRIDLRTAISLLRPKPDFEIFARELLKSAGYQVFPNQKVDGFCVDHEIDGTLVDDEGNVFMLEVKHHVNPHVYTGMDVCLVARAVFEDINRGFETNKNDLKLDGIVILCNTKFSEHATRYANCTGINLIGWDVPEEFNVEKLVEENKLYPITLIKNLGKKDLERFGDAGIVLLKQLVETSFEELRRKTRIHRQTLEWYIKIAKSMLE